MTSTALIRICQLTRKLTLEIEPAILVNVIVGHVDELDGVVSDAANDEGDVAHRGA